MTFETKERRRPTIEEQFDNPKTIEAYGEEFDVVDITPEEQKTEVPTVIAPGWSATPAVFKDVILALARKKRRVVSANAVHGINLEGGIAGTEEMPEAELRKVAALMKTIEEKGIKKVDAVGHSEAGLYLAIAATLYPEKFRNIVLINPAGIIGKDTLLQGLIPRFVYNVFLKQPFRVLRGEKEVAISEKLFQTESGETQTSYIAETRDRRIRIPGIVSRILVVLKEFSKAHSNPVQIVQTAKEARAIATSDIREMLECLKEQGIGVSIIHSVDDSAFPMERVQEAIGTEHVDGFYVARGTHNSPYFNPEKYTPLIDQALDALEKKQIRKEGVASNKISK